MPITVCWVYKEGALDWEGVPSWDWAAHCPEDDFVNILRETDGSTLSYDSFLACTEALDNALENGGIDSSQMVIDADYEASDTTKPPGCYIECVDGVI